MKVEILCIEGCPNILPTVERVRESVSMEGVIADLVQVNVASESAAHDLKFIGSPTVRVDGVDIEPAASNVTAFGLACRTYLEDGKRTGAPSMDLIRSALRRGQNV